MAAAIGQLPGTAQETAVRFERMTVAAGIAFTHTHGASADKHLVETMGSGALFFDYDDDGLVDIVLVDGGSLADPAVAAKARHRLFRNRGGGTFEDVTAASGIRHRDYGQGACAGDYDNDGRVDLYVTNLGPNVLYRNTSKGFVDVTESARVGSPLWGTSCAFADFDRDGYLDLFVANYLDAHRDNNQYCGDPRRKLRVYCHPLNYKPQPGVLYRGSGSGVFTDVSDTAGVARFRGNGLGVVVADYNDDRWPDIFVANDAVPNFLFRNDRNGTFTETALAAGVAVARDGKPRAGMGTDVGDYNRDGRLDLVVTNHEFETHSLFRNDGSGLFTDVTIAAGLSAATRPFVGFGTALFDYDNDAWLDLAIVNGHVVDNTAMVRAGSMHAQRRLLFRNHSGKLVEVGRQSGTGFAVDAVGRTLVAGDIDNDGDLDLLVTNNGGAAELLRNDGGNRRNALLLKLIGTKSNRDAVGARVRVTAAKASQVGEVKAGSSYLGQNDTRLHFGIGAAQVIDRIEIDWPSGHTETVERVPANRLVRIREGEGVVAEQPFRASR
jgi:hypothetical protein